MVETGHDSNFRLSLPDIRQKTRSTFARFAAIALVGTSLLLSRSTEDVSASPHSLPDGIEDPYYEPSSKYDSETPDKTDDAVKVSHVMVCFEDDAHTLIDKNVDAITHTVDVNDVQFHSDPLVNIPCASALVTEEGYAALQINPDVTSVSYDVELELAGEQFKRETLSGDLADYVGATYAESHGFTGEGQRIAVIDTGSNYDSPYNSYRESLDPISGCVGTTYPQLNLYSGCPGGEPRVIGLHAGNVYSRFLVSAGHGDAVAQVAHGVARDAQIVPISLTTVQRQEDGEQLSFYGSDIVRAIDVAIDLDVDSIVVSLAVEGEAPPNCHNFLPSFNLAQQEAHEKGIPMFISTGNSGVVSWPACIRQPGLYPMTTVDFMGQIPLFGGYKDDRVLAARGEDARIVSLFGTTHLSSGTSFAPPVAASLYSIWVAENSSYTDQETMNLMRRFAGIATAQNGDIVPNLNIENVLRQPGIAHSLGIYFSALFPYLSKQN